MAMIVEDEIGRSQQGEGRYTEPPALSLGVGQCHAARMRRRSQPAVARAQVGPTVAPQAQGKL
jgi:hypothetical protein